MIMSIRSLIRYPLFPFSILAFNVFLPVKLVAKSPRRIGFKASIHQHRVKVYHANVS